MSIADIDDDDDKWMERLRTLKGEALDEELLCVIAMGDYSRCKAALDRGADANALDSRALVLAARTGNISMLEMLIGHGLDVKKNLDAALCDAVYAGVAPMTERLLSMGADARYADNYCLWLALESMAPCHDVVPLLMDAGADPNGMGGVLLAKSIAVGKPWIALLLLEAGADPDQVYKKNSAYQWARAASDYKVMRALHQVKQASQPLDRDFFLSMSAGDFQVPQWGHFGRTGLFLAALTGNFDVVVEKMVDAGISPVAGDMKETIAVLAEAGQLMQLFDPRLWAGRKEALAQFCDTFVDLRRYNIDIGAALAEVDAEALRRKNAQGGRRFKL